MLHMLSHALASPRVPHGFASGSVAAKPPKLVAWLKQAPCCVQDPSGDDSHLDEDGSEHDDDGEGMSEESFTDEDDDAHEEDQREVSNGHHEPWGCSYCALGLIVSFGWFLKARGAAFCQLLAHVLEVCSEFNLCLQR